MVSQVRLDSLNPDTSFSALLENMRNGQLPQSITVDVLCEPDDLGERFRLAGASSREQTLMYLELENPEKPLPSIAASEKNACRVGRIGLDSLREWMAIPTRWLWLGDETMLERNFRLYLPSFPDPRFTFFAARREGEIVSTAILFTDDRGTNKDAVAGVYAVATPERERGKGYGCLVTLACVKEARLRGYKAVVLYATPLGLPIFEKIGFCAEGKATQWRIEPKLA